MTAQALAPQVLAASTQGASIALDDCEFSTGAIIDLGTVTAANVTSLVVQIEESTDGSSGWAAISGMVATVTATTAATNLHQVVRGQRQYKYVRANAITLAATTTTGAFPCSVVVIAQRKYMAPAGYQGGVDRYPSS